MKKKHLLRSVFAIVLCVFLIGTAIAVGYTISEYQGKKVVIDKDNNMPVVRPNYGSASATVTTENGLTNAFLGLIKLSNNNLESAIQLVDYAINKEWAGIYALPKSAKTAQQIEQCQSNTDWESRCMQ